MKGRDKRRRAKARKERSPQPVVHGCRHVVGGIYNAADCRVAQRWAPGGCRGCHNLEPKEKT